MQGMASNSCPLHGSALRIYKINKNTWCLIIEVSDMLENTVYLHTCSNIFCKLASSPLFLTTLPVFFVIMKRLKGNYETISEV